MRQTLVLIFVLLLARVVYAQSMEQSDIVSSQQDSAMAVLPVAPELPVADKDTVNAQTSGIILPNSPARIFSSSMYSGADYYSGIADWSPYPLRSLPGWLVFSSEVQSYPGMMQKESGHVGVIAVTDNLDYRAYIGAVKYGSFNSLITSYYIGGDVSYRINPTISLTVFGTYYSRNPYLGMAAYPYVQTSNFGGYITISPNSTFSLSLGAKSYYDPIIKKMETDPIIAPTVRMGKVRVGIDVGHAAKSYLRSLFHHWSK